MAIYSFNTILLSAQKTGTPNLIGTSLSANGVNTVSLSTNDVGIAFNPVTPIGATTTVSIQGSVFTIDCAYHSQTMALLKTNNFNTIFTHTSAGTVIPLSAQITNESDVMTPESRRKYLYGYV